MKSKIPIVLKEKILPIVRANSELVHLEETDSSLLKIKDNRTHSNYEFAITLYDGDDRNVRKKYRYRITKTPKSPDDETKGGAVLNIDTVDRHLEIWIGWVARSVELDNQNTVQDAASSVVSDFSSSYTQPREKSSTTKQDTPNAKRSIFWITTLWKSGPSLLVQIIGVIIALLTLAITLYKLNAMYNN